jgi:hypothetical protein
MPATLRIATQPCDSAQFVGATITNSKKIRVSYISSLLVSIFIWNY